MKTSHIDQLELLELQKPDQKESVLPHKRDSHSAYVMVREFAGCVADLRRATITQSAVAADTMCEVIRTEDEIVKVTERQRRQQSRIDNNQVPLRDISAIEHEIAQMDRRLAKLENDQVEAEEHVEAARAAQDQVKTETQAIVAGVETLKAQSKDDVANSDDELYCVIVARHEPADRLPADLLEEYEDTRRCSGVLVVIEIHDGYGIGVAADLSPMKLEYIHLAPTDELYLTKDTI